MRSAAKPGFEGLKQNPGWEIVYRDQVPTANHFIFS
jgi:hypothetical protein